MAVRVGIIAEPEPLAEELVSLVRSHEEILTVALVERWHPGAPEHVAARHLDAVLLALPDQDDGGLAACRALSDAAGDDAPWIVLWTTRPLDEGEIRAAGVDLVLGEATTREEIRDALLASLL